ncbi:penicillin-binding protein 2 [Candidatus Parcubacteria bacterium]|nr:penicillin-binding protein 2 [Candidatus Parcubacteria bacterium]
MDFLPFEPHTELRLGQAQTGITVEDVIADLEAQKTGGHDRLEGVVRLRTARASFIAGAGMLVLFWLFAFRYEVLEGSRYRALALRHTVQTLPVPAPRGIITDRDGHPVVQNVPGFTLEVVPDELPRGQALDKTLERLSELFALDRAELRRRVLKAQTNETPEPVVVWPGLTQEAAVVFETRTDEFPGFGVGQELSRVYPDRTLLSHIIGYVGRVGAEERQEQPDYALADLIGKTGIEKAYDAVLRGEPGLRRRRTEQSDAVIREPRPGQNVELSISRDLQTELTESLTAVSAALGKKKGAAVAMDPNTGEILALVSLPTFDSNLFVPGTGTAEEIDDVLNDPDEPIFNRALSGQYPSGSTIKPFIAIGALAEKILSPSRQVFVTGSISVPHPSDPAIVYTFHDWKPHGWVNMVRAIAVSSNVYFYTVGGGYGDIEGLGIERIAKHLARFGLGQKAGLELPESTGLVPTPDWKVEARGAPWYIGDTYNVSIGQGDFRLTPLQLTRATAAIANGGRLVQPTLVRGVFDASGQIADAASSKSVDLNIPVSDLDIVRRGLREAVLSGSSIGLSDLPVAVAGKTGTAQIGNGKTHAWFTGFTPFDHPKIVLTVLIEEGGEGSQAAVPVAKKFFERYFRGT